MDAETGMKIPFWFRIAVFVILATALIAALFIGGGMLLDIWAQNHI